MQRINVSRFYLSHKELEEPDEQLSAADRRNADWMLSADCKSRPDRAKRRSSKDSGQSKARRQSGKARKKSLENKKLQHPKRMSVDRGAPIVADHGTSCPTEHGHDDREITPTLVQVDYGTKDPSSKSSEELVAKMLKTSEGGQRISCEKRSATGTDVHKHGSFLLLYNCSVTHVENLKSRMWH